MNQTEIDLLNFENNLLQTRKKLNDLIYQFSHNPQTPPAAPSELPRKDYEKLFGLYILSFGLLSAGFLLSRENPATFSASPTAILQSSSY